MRLFYRSIIFFLLLYAKSLFADQLIIEPDMGRAPIIQAIKEARLSVRLVMYGYTDTVLLDTLLQQKASGKSVMILLEQTPYKAENENAHAIALFNTHHLDWHGAIPPLRFIHQKTLLIDDQKALIMTFNFTHATFKNERNFALVITDPSTIRDIAAVFSADWNHVPIHPDSPRLIFSPDNSRQKLLSIIQTAKRSIRVYAQNISDYKIAGALAKAARKGVKIDIITSAKIREKQADYLTKAGVTVHQSKALYIHAKVMIIDQQTAIIGSINLTRGSLDNNRELAVITTDPTVIKQLNRIFDQDAANSDGRISAHRARSALLPDERSMWRAVRLFNQWMKPSRHSARKRLHKQYINTNFASG